MNRACEPIAKLLGRFYGRVLAVYPVEFREEYGAEMVQYFHDECHVAVGRGGLPALAIQGIRTLADLIRTAPGVHMEILRQDLRFGLRMLRNSPAFALTAILALALGIGANSAIFSMVHGIVVSPLPFPESDRLVMVWEKNPRGIDRNSVSPPNFTDYRQGSKAFSAMAAFYESGANLTGTGDPEHLVSALVTPEFFEVLGVRPVVGSGFRAARGDTDIPEAVLSYGLWQRRFGGDPGVVGKTLRIDDKLFTVSGAMPESFRFPSRDAALWVSMPRSYFQTSRQAHFLSTVARLKSGTALPQARAELDTLAAGLARAYPTSNRGWGVTLVSLKEQVIGEVRPSLLVLLGAVGFILLIACVNITNLLLARSTRRRGEIAIRTALGASSTRIGRQLLTESVLLSLLGGMAGLLLCWGALAALKILRPAAIPRLDDVGVSGWVIGFTFAVAAAAGILSGIAPALRGSRANLREDLKEGLANRKSFASHWLRGALISAEIALALLLMIGAGLLIRSFVHLQRLDPGFQSGRGLTFDIDLPQSRYPNTAARAVFLEGAAARVRALPGVEAAGMISNLPLTGGEGFNRFGFTIDRMEDPATKEDHRLYARWITPGYFAAMGIPVLRGRDFTEQDRAGTAASVIIDAALARRYFPNQNPVGQFVRLSYDQSAAREVVGVAGEVRLVALEKEAAPQVYIPVLQESRLSTISLVIRTSLEHPTAAEAVRQELHRMDASLPVYGVQSLEGRVAESIAPRRFNMLLMTLMAALAFVLATVGVYGVISYMVGERLHEIGIRTALGARPAEILLLVLRQGMRYALTGVGMGLLAALLLTKAMAGLLFGVGPIDGWTFGTVAVLTAGVAGLACLIPAWRASHVDPVDALRPR